MEVRQAIQLEALERTLSNPSEEPVRLSYPVLETITNNFAEVIGRGGFGVVYLGSLRGGSIAVKKLSNAHDLDDKLFTDEVNCLIRAKHENIVRFLGYCADTYGEMIEYRGRFVLADVRQRILCFEYVPNGNLYQYLKDNSKRDEWHMRYEMIRGICHGLKYLHEELIIHLDLKPENIMLDTEMKPKITDFGLSRCFDEGQSRVFTQNIAGTWGYLAPEVIDNGEISLKSDIFSLGIIIIKLLTGRNEYDLENWHTLLDMDGPEMKICIRIAQTCLHADQHERPSIGKIIHELNEVENINSKTGNDTWSSTCQVRHGFHGTDLLDVHPLELFFPFEPNKDISCSLSLTNRADRKVGFLIIPGVPDRYLDLKFLSAIMKPMSTTAITVTMGKKDKPLLGTDNFEILIFMVRSESNLDITELMSSVEEMVNIPIDDLLKKAHELGGQVHRGKLTAAVHDVTSETRDPTASLSEATTKYRFMDVCGESGGIHRMVVHPTEPWILVIHKEPVAYIWNCQTGEKVSKMCGDFNCALFIARKQWLLLGKTDGHIFVCTYPIMDKVKKFRAHHGVIRYLDVHPTHPLVLSCTTESIKLWDWELEHDGDWYCNQIHEDKKITYVWFDQHNTTVFNTKIDGVLKTGTIDSSRPITKLGRIYASSSTYAFSGTNKYVTIGFFGKDVNIRDPETGERLHTISTHHKSIVTCDGHMTHPLVATASQDGMICLWNSITYRLQECICVTRGTPKDINFVGLRSLAIRYDGYEEGIEIVDFNLE